MRRARGANSGLASRPIRSCSRHPENGKPLDIKIGLHIVNISSIDEVNEQFQMDAYLFAQWIDPRLAYTQEGPRTSIVITRSGRFGFRNSR